MRALSWSYNLVTRGSRGENLVQFLDERRRCPWRRDLLGGVVFRGLARLGVFLTHWSWAAADGVGYSVVWQAERVLLRSRCGVRSFGGGRRLSHVCRLGLLAADHGGWCCLAIVSAAGDCVEGRRLRHRHQGMAWLADDRGGLLSLAGLSGVVHRRKMHKRLLRLAGTTAEVMCVGEASR